MLIDIDLLREHGGTIHTYGIYRVQVPGENSDLSLSILIILSEKFL